MMHSLRSILLPPLLSGLCLSASVATAHAQASAEVRPEISVPDGTLVSHALTPVEERIAAQVDARAEEAIGFLEQVVNINSGTGNAAGVRAASRDFRAVLDALGFRTRWVGLPGRMKRAGHLFAERDGTGGRHVLLIGHLDTVYESDDAFQTFTREDRYAHGPGVIDAKGGAVVLLYALQALQDAGVLDGAGITVALMGDEELPGAPYEDSRAALIAAARESEVALGFEPAAADMGHATPVRLGFNEWALHVSTPRAPGDTAQTSETALRIASEMLQRFQREQEEHLTVFALDLRPDSAIRNSRNTGGRSATSRRSGGLVLTGGVRFASAEQLARVKDRMLELAQPRDGVVTNLVFGTEPYPGMPPRPESFALLDTLSSISFALGAGPVRAGDPERRGGGDISFVGHLIPGLDGLGPTGSGAHSAQETVDLPSLALATKRAALLIHRLTRE